MALTLENHHNHSVHNGVYNQKILGFLGNVFQTEKIGLAGYIFGGQYIQTQFPSTPVHQAEEIDVAKIKRELGGQLLHLELILNYCLTQGDSTLYTLLGAMGSGKSSSLQFVFNSLAQTHKEKFYHIYINFNEGYTNEDVNKSYSRFLKSLLKKLKSNIHTFILKNDDVIPIIYSTIKDGFIDYDYFYDFRETIIEKNWIKKPLEDKITNLFNYVKEDSNSDIEDEIVGLMELLRLINEKYLSPNSFVFFTCYDNIDKFTPNLQVKILKFILQAQRASKVRCILPLRRSTFSKIKLRAQLSNQNINQTGPAPVEVVIKIIDQVLKDWETIKLDYGFDEEISSSIYNRFVHVGNELSNFTRTRDLFELLSGKSIKIGLKIVLRLFITNFIPWYEDPTDAGGQYGRSILIPFQYENSYLCDILKSDHNDKQICNIFTIPKTNEIHFLKIRILQLLKNYEEMPDERKVSKVISIIDDALGRKYTDEQYLNTLNDLLYDERPLIGGERRAKYKSYTELEDINDVLRLTELGEGYLKLLGNVRYVQEMLFQLDLPTIHSNEIGDNISSRFSSLRDYLYFLSDLDTEETLAFNKYSIDKSIIKVFKPQPITHYTIYNIAKAFMNISTNEVTDNEKEKKKLNPQYQYFLTLRKDLLDECGRYSNLIYGILNDKPYNNRKLNSLYNKYQNRLRNTDPNKW